MRKFLLYVAWNSSLCVSFIDNDKAFNSLDRECLWKLLRHYGIPSKINIIIQNSYEESACNVISYKTKRPFMSFPSFLKIQEFATEILRRLEA